MALCGLVIFPSCANNLPTPYTGEVYWNTSSNELRSYNGTTWAAWRMVGDGINGGVAGVTGGDCVVCTLCNGILNICHVFYNSGTLCLGTYCDSIDNACIFAISGGGGGGTNVGGGGGGSTFAFGPLGHTQPCAWAGPYSFKSSVATSYSITVGAGGSISTSGGQTEVELVMHPSSPPNLCAGTPNTLITFIPCSIGAGGSTESGVSPGNGGAAGCCSAGSPFCGCCPADYPLAGQGGELDNPFFWRTSGGGGGGLYWNCTCWPTRGCRNMCTTHDGDWCLYGGSGARGYCHPEFLFIFGGGGGGSSHIAYSPGFTAPLNINQPLVIDINQEVRTDGHGGCGGASGYPGTGPTPTGGSGGACTGAGGGGGAWTGSGGNGGGGFVVIKRPAVPAIP